MLNAPWLLDTVSISQHSTTLGREINGVRLVAHQRDHQFAHHRGRLRGQLPAAPQEKQRDRLRDPDGDHLHDRQHDLRSDPRTCLQRDLQRANRRGRRTGIATVFPVVVLRLGALSREATPHGVASAHSPSLRYDCHHHPHTISLKL
ncbi:hypothetical protein [Ktedonospora formicarum]|uniref:hypothetical protein n=1 Tax=Ktedonospora formicarum TaxID=2778364 RepID=UPI001C6884A5|nr:hypothetical protein [Ktedonospora formicarum]